MKGISLKVGRRQLLSGASVSVLTLLAPFSMAQNSSQGTLFIVLKGLGLHDDLRDAVSLIAAFARKPIPVSVVVEAANEPLTAQNNFANLKEIMRFAATNKGVVEVVIGHKPIESVHRYLHLRDATDLGDRIAALVGESGAARDDITTIYNLSSDVKMDPFAYRSAGFRVQISSGALAVSPSGTDAEPIDWGILRLAGGIQRLLADDPTDTIEAFRETDGPHLLVLDAAGLDPAQALLQAELWASSLDHVISQGRMVPVRPRDYLLQGNPGLSKVVALAFDLGNTDVMSDDIREFTSLLDEIQIPYTIIASSRPRSLPQAAGFCNTTVSQLSDPNALRDSCYHASSGDLGVFESNTAEIILDRSSPVQAPLGPRDDGRFHVQIGYAASQRLLVRLQNQPLTDGVVVVQSDEINTRFRRVALQSGLQQIKRDGFINFTTIEGLRDVLAAPDSVLSHFWSARRRYAVPVPAVSRPSQSERDLWMQDANLAWTYLQRFTRNDTGLCAGTVNSSGNRLVINNELTLWDVGSQIQATIAAKRLGIIALDEATDKITKALQSIPTVVVRGLRLPPAMFDAATRLPVRAGFDACDTGRFLIALKRAVNEGVISLEFARSVFLQWDLSAIIIDKRPFTITSKGWNDVSLSHCTHYIRIGYAFVGLEIESQLPKLSMAPSADERIGLLYKSAEMGPFGPEPALLEAIEGHQSREARYLCDVLFDAQLSQFERTGQIRLVSETPINRSPWFVYQGLRPDLPEAERWIIRTIGSAPTESSDPALENSRMISTKAIYLWATTYSHSYSKVLLDLAREHAQLGGFGHASGLHEGNLRPMPGYSDVNTNGIILSSIAHLLT